MGGSRTGSGFGLRACSRAASGLAQRLALELAKGLAQRLTLGAALLFSLSMCQYAKVRLVNDEHTYLPFLLLRFVEGLHPAAPGGQAWPDEDDPAAAAEGRRSGHQGSQRPDPVARRNSLRQSANHDVPHEQRSQPSLHDQGRLMMFNRVYCLLWRHCIVLRETVPPIGRMRQVKLASSLSCGHVFWILTAWL